MWRAVNLSGIKDRGSGKLASIDVLYSPIFAIIFIANKAIKSLARCLKGSKMRVLVLGSGLLGVSSAYYLSQLGHEVAVSGRQASPAAETSFANGGQISVSHASLGPTRAHRSKYCNGWAKKMRPCCFVFVRICANGCGVYSFCESAHLRVARHNIEQIVRLGTFAENTSRHFVGDTGLSYPQRTQGI